MTPMIYRHLGNSGLKVSVLSIGGWLTFGGHTEKETALECLKAAYDNGINFFDNAEEYSDGNSELLYGEAFRRFGWDRTTFVVSTKIFWGGKGVNQRGLSRKHIVEGTNASLKRLGLDYVDLIYAHRPDDCTPMEEVVRAFNWVISQGKAFYWGTSEWSAEEIADAHRVAEKLGLIGPLMEQPEYNMFKRHRVEVEYQNLYQKYGLGLTVYSPLACGVLTGKYNDLILPQGSRLTLDDEVKEERWLSQEGQANILKARKLQEIALRLGVQVSHLALAWCISNANVSTAIFGASKVSQVHDNLKALEALPLLTAEVVAEIEDVLGNKPKSLTSFR
ncbi:NADP-dependent oxidoreductase domain-containing protein [Polychytrium aggregatum]|uniref:NADP-dependent oxidoreductase domain-containing protein n=1 Tax=Polychytrium aggregatum TaxID=110093 RepID=UPI0022FE5A36|nr:NADP-dependent oxidoreductase domain-containing protein [Polychytrium aggregatum]KAI9205896.1 NADP-dependent oxidoreductase domain-containing protein [Polychytrium aggregatum]